MSTEKSSTFSLEPVESPSRRWDGTPKRAWEIKERQRQDLERQREQLDFAAKRRAAAQEAARLQKVNSVPCMLPCCPPALTFVL